MIVELSREPVYLFWRDNNEKKKINYCWNVLFTNLSSWRCCRQIGDGRGEALVSVLSGEARTNLFYISLFINYYKYYQYPTIK